MLSMYFFTAFIGTFFQCGTSDQLSVPLVVVTWDFKESLDAAWTSIYDHKKSALDSIETGCNVCEDLQCNLEVGFGGSPDENGETTLDAMIMDGVTMNVGAIGGLRRVKNAISVARKVLDNTEHTLLVGDLATDFAFKMGFKNESLITNDSKKIWTSWRENECQPNFWTNVNPANTCGPYQPGLKSMNSKKKSRPIFDESNHDTIGMIAIDTNGHIAAGTSTNGPKYKIPGRVGDSPIPGSGSYADQEVGAAAATGDGDIMMRFLPSFLIVELMRSGVSPRKATRLALQRIVKYYPDFNGALIALNKAGDFGAACHGWKHFPMWARSPRLEEAKFFNITCY